MTGQAGGVPRCHSHLGEGLAPPCPEAVALPQGMDMPLGARDVPAHVPGVTAEGVRGPQKQEGGRIL